MHLNIYQNASLLIQKMTEKSLFFSDNQDISLRQETVKYKIEQSIISSDLKDSPIHINKDILYRIFFDFCEELDSLVYSPSHNQPYIFNWIFMQIVDDLKYRKTNPPSSSEMRASIIKKVLDDFVRETACVSSKKERQRLNASDIKFYQRTNIEPPPSNVNIQYISKLFRNADFNYYYQEYLRRDRVAHYFLTKCHEEAHQLVKFMDKCNNSIEKRVQTEFSKMKKPITLAEVRAHEIEALIMMESYCK